MATTTTVTQKRGTVTTQIATPQTSVDTPVVSTTATAETEVIAAADTPTESVVVETTETPASETSTETVTPVVESTVDTPVVDTVKEAAVVATEDTRTTAAKVVSELLEQYQLTISQRVLLDVVLLKAISIYANVVTRVLNEFKKDTPDLTVADVFYDFVKTNAEGLMSGTYALRGVDMLDKKLRASVEGTWATFYHFSTGNAKACTDAAVIAVVGLKGLAYLKKKANVK